MYEFKNSKSGDKRLVPIFIDFKRVTLVDRIGGGEFGDVYKGVISNRKRSVFMFLGSKITKVTLVYIFYHAVLVCLQSTTPQKHSCLVQISTHENLFV